ncbi:polysaccharide pyruvyl transferase family protein [Dolichospermum flos-aquae]|uniref:Polysaccharide pyruvyl transferase family protein n=1 Tax=Dolichospermum flos-aquae LEGE 04289 TaxID=1828708 RepID=A0ACC5Q4X4_DOLFA|nr:polysaccharide pyruvyl transferase family protein [Dolichospermum flos-aquae]MBE9220221.1 polysaccharide pyruvyl transferase family protein [Dolichospermum flos-aquae LEGE 04289]
MKKVVITGVTGMRNRGVDALVSTTIENIHAIDNQINIIVQTQTPEYDRWKLRDFEYTTTFGYPENFKDKLKNKLSSFYSSFAFDYDLIKSSDLLIASGGDLFTSDYKGALEFYLKPLKLALKLDVPIVLLGQSISFNTTEEEKYFLELARHAKLITVRESISYSYLTDKLRLPSSIVKQTADSAFLLKIPAKKIIDNLLQSYGCIQGKPLVVISPSQGIANYSNTDEGSHFKSWTQVIDFILNRLDAQILIIPHAQDPKRDDRTIGSNLHQFFEYDSRIHLAGADHTASEFKGMISHADFVIAERMHAAIAGLSSCVPTVVVGYSIKAEGIMADLLGDQSAQEGMLISIHNFLDFSQISPTLETAWAKKEEVREHLKKVIPIYQEKAEKNFHLIAKLLQDTAQV